MSKHSTSRRDVLAGAAGVITGGTLAAVDATAEAPSALLLEHRQLMGWPRRPMTDHEAYARIDRMAEVAGEIWATPVRSWGDVVARAEIAAFWRDQYDAVGWAFKEYDCPFDRCIVELIKGVLTLAKGGARV